MDIEDYKYQRSSHFLKRILQLFVSIALFSIFLCYSSGFSWFPQSFNVYFSTYLFSFFTHTLERKYMFLMCNGILAILAKSNISSSSSHSESSDENYLGERVSISSSSNCIQTKPSLAEEELMAMPEEEEEQEDDINGEAEELESEPLHVEEEEESEASVVVEDDEGESQSLVKEEEPAEEAAAATTANEDGPSTDELNRKIEEFIRKMKEEIRIEAQQQLIAAA
ncbi:hypothetical protein SLE2022_367930 [Rubroshorea leprosula]